MALTFGVGNRSIAFAPTSAFPLNANSYFESMDAAQAAALSAKPAGDTSTKYYFGQEIVVVDLVSDVKTAQMFIIAPTKDEENNEVGMLAEVGGKIEIDENQFVLADDKLSLLGFAGAVEGAQLVKVGGKLSWVKPDNTTVEGLSTNVAALQATVLGTLQEDGETRNEDGLIHRVAALENEIGDKANSADVYTKGEADELLDDKANSSEVYTKEETYTKTEANALLGDKANSADVYNKTETYTKTEVESYVQNQIGSAGHLNRQIVEALPDVATADVDTIYMLKKVGGLIDNDHYEEYMVIQGKWELIGDTYVDLTPYAKTEDIQEALNLAGSALQAGDIATGTSQGTISVDGTDVVVNGLGSAAFEDADSFEAAGNAAAAEQAAKTHADGLISAEIERANAAYDEKGAAAQVLIDANSYTNNKVGTPAILDEEGKVTTEGTGVYAQTYTRQQIEQLIADITGGESAADVLAALNTYKGTNDTRVKAVEDRLIPVEEKLATVAQGAQVNVLEAIKLEGEENPLEIAEKTVTLPVATETRLGLVKVSDDDDASIVLDENKTLQVNQVNVNKLVQTAGEFLILNGGAAAG